MTQEQVSDTITIEQLYAMQEVVSNLEAALKIKREQFLDACRRWYPQEQKNEYCKPDYELHWISRSVRSVVAAKLKQDMPSTYNLIVKETVNVADAEKALGDTLEHYITIRTTYSPKVIRCYEMDDHMVSREK